MKNILVLTSSFPRFKLDWWAQFILNIYTCISKDNNSFYVLAPHAPGAKTREQIQDISIHRFIYFFPLRYQKLTSGKGIIHSSKENLFNKLQIGCFIMSEFFYTIITIITKKFDIIHAHWILPQGVIAVIAKKIFNIPVVLTIHGSDIYGFNQFNWLKKIVLDNVDYYTVNSSSTYLATKKITNNSHYKIIPMGVNTDIFATKKNKNNQVKTLYGEGPLLLCVGRLIPCKGFVYAIQALPAIIQKYTHAHLLIVGIGPEKANLLDLVAILQLQKHVSFIGSKSQYELSQLYSSCDVYIAPSITDTITGETEGQNITILEALASKIPVVASESGGIPDMVDGTTTGFLVKERSSLEISKKVIKLLCDKKLCKSFKENGAALIKEKYTLHKMAAEFERIYETIK